MRNPLKRPGFWILVVLAIVAVAVVLLRMRGPAVRTTLAVRKDLEQHLVASGRVRVPTRVQVAAQTSGLVTTVAVVEGQRVKAGDLLVQIDDREQVATVAQAEAGVKQASARVDQLRKVGAIVANESLRQAQTNLEKAQEELARTEKLAAAAAIPAVELENAQRAVSLATAQRSAAEAQQVSSQPAGADSRIALTALIQAQAQLTGAKVRLAQTRVVAPKDGTVLSRSVEPGDVVQPTRTLLVFAADASTELVFQADERNLAFLHVDLPGRASADAYPQELFDARVSYIAPSIDPARGSVEVRLAVPEPPAQLRPDMTVTIDLLIASKKTTLVVPSEVVRDAATPTPYVLVVENGRVARKDVVLGIRGDGSIEIASGLSDGAEVIYSGGLRLDAGARVRTERQ